MMQKLRKNSLSPCYSTANKQNISLQNMASAIGISFRNLQQVRKRKGTCHHPQPLSQQQLQLRNKFTGKSIMHQYNFNVSSPISEYHPTLHQIKQIKAPKLTQKTRRQSQRSIDDYRSSLKSKQKQMSSLHSQVNSLTETISLLKEQLNSLKTQNRNLHIQNLQLKKKMSEKIETIQKLRKQKINQLSHISLSTHSNAYTSPTTKHEQCIKCKQRQAVMDDYQQVIQKLNELQQIQNQLLRQNQNFKKKQVMNKAMFRNLKTLLDGKKISQAADLLSLLIQ